MYSEVRGAVQHENGTRWLTVRFLTGVLMTTCSALLVSAAFFAFIPRVWVGPEFTFQDDANPIAALARRTGLASSIRLGEMGRVLESHERVFEIQLTNRITRENISVESYTELLGMNEPLFRGAVFTNYDKGRWSLERGTELHVSRLGPAPPPQEAGVRQNIRMEQTSTSNLFSLGQPLSAAARRLPVGDVNEMTGIATRNELRGELAVSQYVVYSALPQTMKPHYELVISSPARVDYKKSGYVENNLKLPEGLTRLKELARSIVEQETRNRQKMEGRSAPRELKSIEIASAIELHLRESGAYKYSLDLSIQDSKIDPVEDFLFNRKAGHCEYFATALALMLRAAGVPARVVSGYKGGMPINDGGYEVQQRFAHLWVEAWQSPDRWITFDATPLDARSLSISEMNAKKASVWSGMQSTLSGLWAENVLNMSLDRQEQSIYKPMRELAFLMATFIEQLFTSPGSAMRTFWNLLTDREKWFSLGGAIFVFVFLLSLSAFVWLVRWSLLRLRRWWTHGSSKRDRHQQRVIEFYERFVRLLRDRGIARAATQTQREFAGRVAELLAEELTAGDAAEMPATVSNLFYRVRFGDEVLPDADLKQLEAGFVKLELALSKNTDTHGRPHVNGPA